jgi:LacI family transcriptional regulator
MRIKSKDIAKALGISTATVSLVINNKPGVNAMTRKKVFDYIKEKEYEEFGIERKETELKKGIIVMFHYYKHGIILSRSKEITSKPVQRMESIAIQAGYRMRVIHYHEKYDKLDSILEELKKEGVQGLYIMGAEMNESDIFPFTRLKVPIVVGDNNFIEQGYDSFLIDNQEGIRRAVDYLIYKGHSHIAYLAEDIDIFNFLERREAFIREMAVRECGNARNQIWYLGNTIDTVYDSISKYLSSEGRLPTAFVLESSIISLGVSKALMERSLRVPRDISLIGFDALPEDSVLGFELTLIRGTHSRRHIAAIKHLIRHIEEKEVETIRIYYKTRLMEGNSVFDKAKYNYTKPRGI